MTPSSKAKELIDTSYVPWHGGSDEATQEDCAKEAAIICVSEIMEANHIQQVHIYPDNIFEGETLIGGRQFWNEVLTELKK